MQFAQILKRTRKMAGLTQEEMAEKLHMSRSNVANIERGHIELKMSDAIRWCQATNMPEVSAAMLCGVDPVTIMQLVNNLPTLLQAIGAAIIIPLLSII